MSTVVALVDGALCAELTGEARSEEVELRSCSDVGEAFEEIITEGERCGVVVVPAAAAERLTSEFEQSADAERPLILVAGDAEQLRTLRDNHAIDELLLWPVEADELVVRVVRLLARWHQQRELEQRRVHAQLLIGLAADADFGAEFAESMQDVLMGLVESSEARRCLVLVRSSPEEDLQSVHLVGNSDDASAVGLRVELSTFPELTGVLESGEPVCVRAASIQPRLAAYDQRAAAESATLLLVPLSAEGSTFGALELHLEEHEPQQTTIDLARAVAALIAPRVFYSEAYRSINEQTSRRKVGPVQAELRNRALQRYREFFNRAPEGTVVLDHQGRVLHLNPVGEQITGYACHGLVGRKIDEIVVERDKQVLHGLLESFASGSFGRITDLGLVTTSGDPIIVSVSTSGALIDEEMLVLSFRDVTESRALSEELRHTKEFLERLIDSTVDAIVASDVEGKLILFNQGAERIFGLTEQEVVGRMSLDDLYPEGVAERLMEQLRGPDGGGVGRLEMVRKEILNANGKLIPVRVSASIIYESDVEVGTVAIISDLRERLHIERRLVQAQEKLVGAERQALIAELAGTTAHELNQPLTSVMGYAELLMRRIASDDSNHRAAQRILQECQRLADIVRKIGKITRYETKAYVGDTQILDLDKASE